MILTTDLFAKLERTALECGEFERCGVLWSLASDRVARRLSAYPGPFFKDRFAFSDQWWMETLYRARSRGLRLEAYYHTHPRPQADLRPSRADRAGHPWGSKVFILGSSGRPPRLFHLFGEDPYQEISFRVIKPDGCEV